MAVFRYIILVYLVHVTYFQMCELLLQKGATVNHSDKRDRRPLHWAASRNHDEVARLLLQGRFWHPTDKS